jgi:hypothetical protein
MLTSFNLNAGLKPLMSAHDFTRGAPDLLRAGRQIGLNFALGCGIFPCFGVVLYDHSPARTAQMS